MEYYSTHIPLSVRRPIASMPVSVRPVFHATHPPPVSVRRTFTPPTRRLYRCGELSCHPFAARIGAADFHVTHPPPVSVRRTLVRLAALPHLDTNLEKPACLVSGRVPRPVSQVGLAIDCVNPRIKIWFPCYNSCIVNHVNVCK